MLSAGSHPWLAGNPGPPPAPATVVLTLVVLVLGLALAVIVAVPRRHREEPLRQEMDARPAVTFTSGVRVLDGAGGLPVPARHRWIEIDGRPPGTAALIWIRQPGRNRQLWYALTGAGAHPIGPPPPP